MDLTGFGKPNSKIEIVKRDEGRLWFEKNKSWRNPRNSPAPPHKRRASAALFSKKQRMRPNHPKPCKNSRNFCVFSAYSPVSLNLEAFSNDTRRFLSDCTQNKKKSSRFIANERIFRLSDKFQVFINRWPTQSANARQFGKGKVSALEGWIMAI